MWSEWLLEVAWHKRRDFFKLWNTLHQSFFRYHSLQEKWNFIKEKLGALPSVSLPLDIHFVSMADELYPQTLYHLPQPPLGLFYRGVLMNHPTVGVVGSRKPLPYSRKKTWEFTTAWVRQGNVIVSGGAIGIDGEAHKACLASDGTTWVVLGGGLNKPHPRMHHHLFERVIESGGAVLSEYPPEFVPQPYTFPERNRIIAALSDILFLAQAHEKSGSLRTAQTALDLGKDVFVLEPLPKNENFLGSVRLIEEGAYCVASPLLEASVRPQTELLFEQS